MPVDGMRANRGGSSQSPANWRASPLYPRVAKLIESAEEQLDSLSIVQRARAAHLLNELKRALSDRSPDRLKEFEDELTDLLFEL